MENERPTITDEQPPPTPATGPSGGRLRRRAALARVLIAVVTVAVLAIAADLATTSPRLCMSCHEIAKRAGSWSRSAHVGVACVSCHQTPRPWYALPPRLVDRVRLFGGDIARHVAGGYQDPVDFRVTGAPPMSDAVCLQCHDPNRKATSGFRIIIDHPAHAKRNGSCVSCHIRTAHPLDDRSAALSLMSACFTCHGTAKTAKAPGRCDLCHPAGYVLRPASHKAADWWGRHGKVARSDVKQCELCHTKSTCDGCHGIEMPHPMGWAQKGHAAEARRDRWNCMRCHTGPPDWCTMCHHEPYRSTKGTWVQQHASVAEKRGISFCLGCHSEIECVRCHRK